MFTVCLQNNIKSDGQILMKFSVVVMALGTEYLILGVI